MLDEMLAPLLTTEWGRRASLGAMIGGACLVAYASISALSTWYSDITLVQNVKAPREFVSSDVQKIIAQIPQYHLFGDASALSQQTVLPVTSLQLRLVGVVKAEPEKFSRVIISEKGQPAKVYHIGDNLPSGVRIHEVISDGVILENGGRLEKLPLQRTQLQFQGMPKSLLPNDQDREK